MLTGMGIPLSVESTNAYSHTHLRPDDNGCLMTAGVAGSFGRLRAADNSWAFRQMAGCSVSLSIARAAMDSILFWIMIALLDPWLPVIIS